MLIITNIPAFKVKLLFKIAIIYDNILNLSSIISLSSNIEKLNTNFDSFAVYS